MMSGGSRKRSNAKRDCGPRRWRRRRPGGSSRVLGQCEGGAPEWCKTSTENSSITFTPRLHVVTDSLTILQESSPSQHFNKSNLFPSFTFYHFTCFLSLARYQIFFSSFINTLRLPSRILRLCKCSPKHSASLASIHHSRFLSRHSCFPVVVFLCSFSISSLFIIWNSGRKSLPFCKCHCSHCRLVDSCVTCEHTMRLCADRYLRFGCHTLGPLPEHFPTFQHHR